MGKLADISAKPTVRDYAHGAAQDAAARLKVASFLAPQVLVSSIVGQYKRYSQKNRFRIPDTRRASGARATTLGFSADDAGFKLGAHALDFPVDQLEKMESEEIENHLKEGADMAAEVGALSHEKETVDKALGVLGAGTAMALAAGDDPIKILDGHIKTVMKAAKYGSLMGVRLLIGAGAWLIIKNHPKVLGRITSNQKGADRLQVDEQVLSGMLLGKPEVVTTYSVYDDAPEGKDEDIKFILDMNIIVFASKPNPTRRDPSFMKTFALRGQFMTVGQYQRDDGRVDVAKFDWMSIPVVGNEEAGIRLNVSEA